MEIHVDTFAEAYECLRHQLLMNGKNETPRGLLTKELLHVTFELRNPRARLWFHPERKFSLPFACAEATLLFDPTNYVSTIAFFNQRMRRFSDDGVHLYGDYGKRIASYLPDLVRKLRNDPLTRQAIVPILHIDDIRAETKDFPCTSTLHFLIRENKLHLFVSMRSNDLYWGTGYDVFVFTILQEILANELDIEMGSYYHTAHSLHVYEQHFEWLKTMTGVQDIIFSVPYRLHDMLHLVLLAKQCKIMNEEAFSECPDAFEYVFEQYARKKRHLPLSEKSHYHAWTIPFLTHTHEALNDK